MQLIKKMFGRASDVAPATESAQFQDSDSSTDAGSRNAPRRELVQVVLRDSMRRHGIPSAWIDCRILSVVTRTQRTGIHVQLIVRDGIDRLLTYVPAFQTSFMDEITRFDPRVDDWLFSVSWQFLNLNSNKVAGLMPDPAVWAATTAASPLQAQAQAQAPATRRATTPGAGALAPEDAAPVPVPAAAPVARPAAGPTPPPPVPTAAQVAAASARDEEVLEDLQALYAIRDAALRQSRPAATGPAGEKDFQSTDPQGDSGAARQPPTAKRW